MLLVALAVAAGAVAAGCLESPVAPAAESAPCGAASSPCPLRCSPSCAEISVDAAVACALTLDGLLDSSRERCIFPDGSEMIFDGSLPASAGDLREQSLGFTSRRPDGSVCLFLDAQPLPWRTGGGAGGQARTVLRTPAGEYRQDLWWQPGGGADGAGSGTDAGSGTGGGGGGETGEAGAEGLTRLVLLCPDGRYQAATAGELCRDCLDLDCRRAPLLELAGVVRSAGTAGEPVVEISLVAGTRITPLFTCR